MIDVRKEGDMKAGGVPRETAEVFGRLYREHMGGVYRLALGLVGNVHDAEEVTQEAFFRAFRSYGQFRGESSFSTWMYRITMNAASDYLKQRTKFPVQALTEDLGYSLEEIIDPNPASDPETELLAYQARVKCLQAMTECLPTEQRKIFCLSITLGLPHKTVAEILDCSVGSVKTALHRARQRWFGYMEERCSLINRANPCTCSQWVRFGLAQGWITKKAGANAPSPISSRAREEVLALKGLRDIYQDLYREKADECFASRLREGIEKGEWAIFS